MTINDLQTSSPSSRVDDRRPSIIVDEVHKRFRVRRAHSMKEALVKRARGEATSKSFEALKGVDLLVREGESVAVLGLNGSGKSTLLKLMSGVLEPDYGRVFTRGRVAALIEVGAGFHPDLSGRENVFLNAAILGMTKKETEERFDSIVEFSEIGDFIDSEVKHYSSGMFMRLAFSVAVHTEMDILLVDEILSVGDGPFRAKCRAKIRELLDQGKTMVVVSHSTTIVRDLCTRAIVIDQGVKTYDGDVDSAINLLGDAKRPHRRAKKQIRGAEK